MMMTLMMMMMMMMMMSTVVELELELTCTTVTPILGFLYFFSVRTLLFDSCASCFYASRTE